MDSAEIIDIFSKVKPLTYHTAIRDFLRDSDRDVWKWLSSHHASPKHAEDVRFELLKSTYRIERDSQPELYQSAEEDGEVLAKDWQADPKAEIHRLLTILDDL